MSQIVHNVCGLALRFRKVLNKSGTDRVVGFGYDPNRYHHGHHATNSVSLGIVHHLPWLTDIRLD